MCGIAGIVGPAGASLELLTEMATVLRHRGPDDEGYVTQDLGGAFRCFRGDETVPELGDLAHWRSSGGRSYDIGLGHRRLSILDLSEAGHQPMLSANGDLALVFNGEIYNYVELADELEALGWRLRPCGDTAVLLAAFSEWGPECVHRLRGMWAFAVYDRRSRRLTLSRDRFGIKPLYYARIGDRFVFSSEVKGLLPAFPGEPRGSVSEAVRLFAWGRMDDEATLFEGVRALPAGSTLHLSCEDLSSRIERYYDIAAFVGEEFEGNMDEAVLEYRRRLSESVKLHMRSDVQVGSCLSGGLDSTLAAAIATSHLSNGRLFSFTAVYDDPAFDERRYVELHAAHSGRLQTHFVSPTAETLLAEIDRLVWAQDQPMGSSSPFAQWSVMQLAGGHRIKVLLDGQGADEAIGGYSYFAGVYLLELARAGHILRALRAAGQLQNRRRISALRELGRAGYHRLPPLLRGPVRHATRVGHRLVAPNYRELIGDAPGPVLRTFRDHSVEALHHSLPELLRYEDRSSMAFSIESRVPFLDHPLVELVLSLPTAFKIHDGWSKFIQRKASEGLVPDAIVWRRDKLGFATPQQAWKRSLVGSLHDFLREPSVPAFLDRAQVDSIVAGDSNSTAGTSGFWRTVFFLKWIQVYRVQFSD